MKTLSTYRFFKSGKSLQASVFGEYPDSPSAGHPLPRNHLDLVGVDLVLAARLVALKDDFGVGHLEFPVHHRAADLGRDVGVLEEVHGDVALRSLDAQVLGDDDDETDGHSLFRVSLMICEL